MLLWLEKLSLLAALYGVTLSILLSENVPLERAASWGMVAAAVKTAVAILNRWLWQLAAEVRGDHSISTSQLLHAPESTPLENRSH